MAQFAAIFGVTLLNGCAGLWMRAPHIPEHSTLSCSVQAPTFESATTIDLFDLHALLSSDRLVFLDVRRIEEYDRGHIQGLRSINIDYLSRDFPKRLAALDRDATYVVYCQCGGRSAEAVKLMIALGFRHILHYREGYALFVAEVANAQAVPVVSTQGN